MKLHVTALLGLLAILSIVKADRIILRSDNPDIISQIESRGGRIDFIDNGYFGISGPISVLEYGKTQAEEIEQVSLSRAGYPTFDQVLTEMQNVASQFTFCTYSVIGKSTNNRDVAQLLIDVDTTIPKPLIMITGTTHGNEKVGSENVLYMLDKLLNGYNSDSDVTELLSTYRLKVVPIMSPDGYYNHSRYVNGNTDPNREFGWQVGYNNGPDNHSVVSFPFKDSEMKAYRNALIEEPWFLSMDYHTGVEAVIVPWFADVPMEPLDKLEFSTICNQYLNHISLSKGLQYGGWMEQLGMPGIQGDYPYSRCGTMSLVMETHLSQAKSPPTDLQQVNSNNYKGFMALAKAANKGVSGTVLNESDEPLYTRVTPQAGFAVLSSPRNGAFFKTVINSGSYSVDLFANGYEKKTISLQSKTGFSPQSYTLTPAPEQNYAALTIEYLRCYNRPKQNDMHNCLELSDGKTLTIQSNYNESHLVVDFGAATPVTNQDGDDLTVILSGSGEYKVYGSSNIDDLDNSAIGFQIGVGTGTTSFDLASSSMDSIRFIKIIVPQNETIQLDAIEAKPIPSVHTIIENQKNSSQVTLSAWKGSLKGSLKLPLGEYSLSITNIHGQRVASVQKGVTVAAVTKEFILGSNLAPGIYFLRVKTNNRVQTFSVPIL